MRRTSRRDYEDYDEEPRARKTQKRVVDPLATQINAAASQANGIFTSISHDMKKALMALKRGDFDPAITAAGSSAASVRGLSDALLTFEDLIQRMKQREIFKAEQIRLIESGEYNGPGSESKVV